VQTGTSKTSKKRLLEVIKELNVPPCKRMKASSPNTATDVDISIPALSEEER